MAIPQTAEDFRVIYQQKQKGLVEKELQSLLRSFKYAVDDGYTAFRIDSYLTQPIKREILTELRNRNFTIYRRGKQIFVTFNK